MSEGEVAAKPAKASSSEIAAIKQQIKKQRESLKDLGKAIFTALEAHKDGGTIAASDFANRGKFSVVARRTLKGHFSKVFGVQWSGDAQKLVSAAQDGFMIVWNPLTCNKNITIPLKSTWIMMCAIEPLEGEVRRSRVRAARAHHPRARFFLAPIIFAVGRGEAGRGNHALAPALRPPHSGKSQALTLAAV